MNLWDQFDKNEISLLAMNAIAYIAIFLLPKKLSREIALLSLVWGFAIGVLFDFTIGGGLLDFYRVNDTNRYELFDLIYYFLFAPFGYLFIYFYKSLNVNKRTFIFYVAGWAIVGVGAHWVFTLMGIIKLQNGYKLPYSFPIFLMIQTITGLYFELIRTKHKISS